MQTTKKMLEKQVVYKGLDAITKCWQTPKSWLTPGENMSRKEPNNTHTHIRRST